MKEFRIYDNLWKVTLTDNKEDLIVDGKFCKGAIHYKESCIYIYSDTSMKDRTRILLHELTHAILYDTQVELKTVYTEEDLCEFTAKYSMLVHSIYLQLSEYICPNKKK